MRIRHGFLGAVLALCLLPAGAEAVPFTFEGTTPDTLIDVKFIADLSIAGDTLTLVLTNDSLNHVNGASPSLNPNDLLTSFYFDVFDGFSRPTLTYATAVGDVCASIHTIPIRLTSALARCGWHPPVWPCFQHVTKPWAGAG